MNDHENVDNNFYTICTGKHYGNVLIRTTKILHNNLLNIFSECILFQNSFGNAPCSTTLEQIHYMEG